MSVREPRFSQSYLVDTTPLPPDIPPVEELGASSAPLYSAAYFIGARCKAYNDDYMKCKTDSGGSGEMTCLKEGRKVTRCATSVLKDINTHCLDAFRVHWQCLEQQNHQLWQCRAPEMMLNKCVYDNLKLEKVIPDAPEGDVPIHLREKQIFARNRFSTVRDLANSPWAIKKDEAPTEPAKNAATQ